VDLRKTLVQSRDIPEKIVSSIEHQTTTCLGLIGAGRLAQAVARTWLVRTGEGLLVWSRSGPHLNGTETRVAEGTWVPDWTRVLETRSIVIAIPGKAFLELAEESEQAKQFTGNVFSAAASLSRESLVRAFPQATIVCIAPFLINAVSSIPMLVLRSSDLPAAQWEKAKAELDSFGDVDVVEDEEVFADMSLLGAPWAAVVMAALEAAVGAGVQRLQDEAAIDMGRRMFFRALHSLLTNHAEQNGSGEIVTPGGITERGLKSLGDLTSPFESAFNQMRARADELRA
jgi:pyrroline-5-carboxylate reductase